MDCENCNKEHDGSYGSGRFCSSKCARSFSTSNKKNEKKCLKCKYCETVLMVGKRANKVVCEKCIKKRHNKKCITCDKYFFTKRKNQKYCCRKCKDVSPELKNVMKEHANKRNFGGHTSKKSIYYKSNNKIIYLQSSYEHKVAIELDENNIKWNRPDFLYWYDADGVRHRYYPDFYLLDFDVYLDPKNDYLIKKDEYKIDCVSKQNNIYLYMLSENQLTWNEIYKKIRP
tara:strand:- start:20619 stop:21305 length:687 start_codon:yes stop_codon:yes gene_type:complete